MDTTTLIGFAGAVTLLVAFVGNAFGKLRNDSFLYGILNTIGATLLVWYAVLLQSLPFILVEGVWAIVGLRELLVALAEKGKNR